MLESIFFSSTNQTYVLNIWEGTEIWHVKDIYQDMENLQDMEKFCDIEKFQDMENFQDTESLAFQVRYSYILDPLVQANPETL